MLVMGAIFRMCEKSATPTVVEKLAMPLMENLKDDKACFLGNALEKSDLHGPPF